MKSGPLLHDHLSRYLLTKQELIENGFPIALDETDKSVFVKAQLPKPTSSNEKYRFHGEDQ